MSGYGSLFVVSGPSGSGKGTILNSFLSSHNKNISLSISATTRSPRTGEIDGKDYYFISRSKFKEYIDQDNMLEHASYCDNYYGTPKKYVMDKCNKGEDVLLEIEVQGALQVKNKLPESVLIFIMPPSLNELKLRLEKRKTEKDDVIEKRLHTAIAEIQMAHHYDYIIINNVIINSINQLKVIVECQKYKYKNIKNIINEVLNNA